MPIEKLIKEMEQDAHKGYPGTWQACARYYVKSLKELQCPSEPQPTKTPRVQEDV